MLILGTQTRRIISKDPYSRLDIVQVKDGGLEGDVDDMRAFALRNQAVAASREPVFLES